MNFKKSDVVILGKMEAVGAINQLKSATIHNLIQNTKLSATKVRASIKLLQANEFIKEGFMQRNAKTYYVTDKGREFLKSFNCPVYNEKNN